MIRFGRASFPIRRPRARAPPARAARCPRGPPPGSRTRGSPGRCPRPPGRSPPPRRPSGARRSPTPPRPSRAGARTRSPRRPRGRRSRSSRPRPCARRRRRSRSSRPELREVGLLVALVVLEERPQHARPGRVIASSPCSPSGTSLPSSSSTTGRCRAAACVAEPGFADTTPGSGEIMIVAGLGLPPGVHDRTALAADHLPVPEPRLRVDRLAHRPEQAQLRQVVLLRVLDAPLHARADRGGRRVEQRHAVALARAPTRCPWPDSPARPRTSPRSRRSSSGP